MKNKSSKILIGLIISLMVGMILIFAKWMKESKPQEVQNQESPVSETQAKNNTEQIQGEKPSDESVNQKESKAHQQGVIPQTQEEMEDAVCENTRDVIKASYLKKKKDTSDYAASLHWFSGIVKEEVMKTDNNFEYKNYGYLGGKKKLGQPFFDKDTNLNDDKVLVIYSEGMDQGKGALVLLERLREPKYYKENSTFTLSYENHMERYQVAEMYELPFIKREEVIQFDTWHPTVMKENLLKSGVEVTSKDKVVIFDVTKAAGNHVVIVARMLKSYPAI